jgi:hypothetical protein
MPLFHHISLPPVDPLADGLDEDIQHEQLEPEAITLTDISEDELNEYWNSVEADIHNDPEWFHFSDEEQS